MSKGPQFGLEDDQKVLPGAPDAKSVEGTLTKRVTKICARSEICSGVNILRVRAVDVVEIYM